MDIQSIYEPEQFVYELFKDINKDDLEYIYRGYFTSQIVVKILALTNSNLEKSDDTTKIKSRIYFIMGEGLQNITKHQDLAGQKDFEQSTIVVIKKQSNKFFITTGNGIKNENISALETKLETINSLSVEELREYARFVRKNFDFTDKGGASLGLIEMAKRSGNKLLYKFNKINENYSFFYLNTEIPTFTEKTSEMDEITINEYSLDQLVDFHDILNKENFILSFKGDFNQENLLNLLSIVEGQMADSTTSIKVYNIMVELLQNIVKHADNLKENEKWKPGIFFINEKNNEYLLTAGNYVLNDKVAEFKHKLEFVNSLDSKGLQNYYNKVLMTFGEESSLKTGLGIIDMRKRSAHNLNFSFKNVNTKFSFYTIQVIISKK